MAKKPFDWVRDDEEPVRPLAQRRSRSQKTRKGNLAAELAEKLVLLPARQWPRLPLEPVTLAALQEFARIKPGARGALKRQLNLISTRLRDDDLEALGEVIDGIEAGRSPRQVQIEGLVRWRTRLLDAEGGKEALTAFIEAYPDANPQRIRQHMAHSAKLIGKPGQDKVNRDLLTALKAAAGLVG